MANIKQGLSFHQRLLSIGVLMITFEESSHLVTSMDYYALKINVVTGNIFLHRGE